MTRLGPGDLVLCPGTVPKATFRARAAAAAAHKRLAYAVASAVGATTVTVVEGPGKPMPVGPAMEAFALLCDRAAAHGLEVAIEFWVYSAIDAQRAAAIVAGAARGNGGLLIDTWHAHHDPHAGDVLRGVSDGGVKSVQISDVGEASPDYFAATMHARRLPGDGTAHLASWVCRLDAAGSRVPLGVEVLSDALHALAPEVAARRAGDAMRALLAEARAES